MGPMATQTEIAQAIVERGGDDVLSWQGNQGNLDEEVQPLFESARQTNFGGVEPSLPQPTHSHHGRIEIPHWTLPAVSALIDSHRWQGWGSVGRVEAQRRINGKTT